MLWNSDEMRWNNDYSGTATKCAGTACVAVPAHVVTVLERFRDLADGMDPRDYFEKRGV